MQINTDVSTEAAASLLRTRADAGTGAGAQSSAGAQTSSQIDPSLQRLTDATPSVQDADWELQDEAGADKAVSFASASMLKMPGTSMMAQGNQLSQNVLSLLQPID
ncbi:MAG TPA: flagellin [Verrucomicrobiae bacterium]|jgi:flagellin-like hook-associated protein FlgL|nr:flagellin [Verrucomicrobiae bacterium]